MQRFPISNGFLLSGQQFVKNVGPTCNPGWDKNPLKFFKILNQHGYTTADSGYPAFMGGAISMGAMILVALLFFQQQQSPPVEVHLPTSDAIDIARKLARDLGYPIDRYPKLYFFDALTPSFAGYVSIGFYGNGHPINHFEINEKTGQVVDSVICEVYDFPDLRVFQRTQQQLSGLRARTTEELTDEVGCDKLKVVRSPVVPKSEPSKK